jgi:MOSC domain-containing protein YiiM
VIVEITRSRRPCEALTVYGPGIQDAIFDTRVRTGDFSSPLWGMSGFYTMVLVPGNIRPGDSIQLIEETA